MGLDVVQDDSLPGARYARGADYHNILGRRLRKLLRQLRESEPGLDGRWYVERPAGRAGQPARPALDRGGDRGRGCDRVLGEEVDDLRACGAATHDSSSRVSVIVSG